MDAWKEKLGMESIWDKYFSKVHSCYIYNRDQLIQFKTVHHLHHSKVKLQKILFLSFSYVCQVKGSRGDVVEHFLVLLFFN